MGRNVCERESGGQLPRSASIDSMVEAAICARHSEPSQPTTLQLPARSDRAFSLASPAVGRRAKTQRGQAGIDSRVKEAICATKHVLNFLLKMQKLQQLEMRLMNYSNGSGFLNSKDAVDVYYS
ncbi:hypothetical protein ACJJTC_017391 [Scirpophaga incertulas]